MAASTPRTDGPGATPTTIDGGAGGCSIAALLCESDVGGLALDGLEAGWVGNAGPAAPGGAAAGLEGFSGPVHEGCSL